MTIVKGPGGYGFYMLGSAEPVDIRPTTIARAVLARPGVLTDISTAYDSPAKTVDDWIASSIASVVTGRWSRRA